jgi:hypothetical protein
MPPEAEDEQVGLSTIPEPRTALIWERPMRLVSVGIIGAVVLAASLGLLGVRTTKTSATGNGLSISVEYAAVSRGGLATPFSVEVATENGSPLPSSTTIRVSSPYLAMFDDNGIEPAPASSFNTGDWTWWTFEVPTGASRLQIDLDARLEPSVQFGRGAEAAVEIEGREVVAAEFNTWVMP